MTTPDIKPLLEDLVAQTSLGQVLDALEDIAIEQAESLRAKDRIASVTWTTASLRIGEAARFALNLNL